jgi:hypothetical protein
MRKSLKKFKEKHSNWNAIFVLVGIVFIWRGIWEFLNIYFLPGNPLLSFGIPTLVGLVYLYFNDSSLSELD